MDETLLVRLVADASQYNRVLGMAEGQLVHFAGRVGAFSGIVAGTMLIAANAVVGLSHAFATAATSAIKLAANYEESSVALRVMVGDANRAKDLMEEINQLAIASPFQSAGLLDVAKMLKGYSVDTENLVPALKVLGDVASGTGGGEAKLHRLALAFGQVKTAGRLMGQDLLQFTSAGVPLIKNLAVVMGRSTDEIKDMVEAGKVGFNDVTRAFNNMTKEGGVFGGMMTEMSKTVKGRWNALTETLEVTMRDLGKGFLEGFRVDEILESLTDLLVDVRNGAGQLKPFFEQMRDGADYLVKMAKAGWEWVKANEAVISKVLIVLGLVIALKASFIAFSLATSVGIGLLTTFGYLTAIVTGLVIAFGLLGPVLAVVAGAFTFMGTAVWDEFAEPVGKAVNSVFDNFSKLAKELKDIGGIAFGGIKAALQSGDLNAVGQVMQLTLEAAFRGAVVTFKQVWIDFRTWFLKNWNAIGFDIEWRMAEFIHEINMIMASLNLTKSARDEAKATEVTNHNLRYKTISDKKFAYDDTIDANAKASMAGVTEQYDVAKKALVTLSDRLIETAKSLDVYAMYVRKYWEDDKAADNLRMKMFEGKGGTPWATDLNDAKSQRFTLNAMSKLMTNPLEVGRAFSDAPMSREAFNVKLPEVGKDKIEYSKLNEGLYLSAYARKVSNDLKKELEAGTSHGQDPVQLFNRNLEGLAEAHKGPLGQSFGPFLDQLGGSFGGAFRGMQTSPSGVGFGGNLTTKQYEFGLNEQYDKLQKAVKVNQFAQPQAEYRGTAAAQDAINAATLRTEDANKSPQERIIGLLTIAKEMADKAQEQRERMAKALESLAGKTGAIIIGDFGVEGDDVRIH